jgi:hypothetical protein
MTTTAVLFIHGLWIHSSAWEPWVARYADPWPGSAAARSVGRQVTRAAYKLYADSAATTDFYAFPDRGHSLVFDHGWREVADATLTWLTRQGLTLRASSSLPTSASLSNER